MPPLPHHRAYGSVPRRFARIRTREQSWSTSKTQVGRLIRLFGGAIDAMMRAREQERDPFDVLDEEIG